MLKQLLSGDILFVQRERLEQTRERICFTRSNPTGKRDRLFDTHTAPDGVEPTPLDVTRVASTTVLAERIAAALTAAAERQREADAMIADAEFNKQYPGVDYGDPSDSCAWRIAAAIRASKE